MTDVPGTVLFPAALDSNASLVEPANQAFSALAGNLLTGGASFTVLTGEGARFSQSGIVQIENEILAYGSRSGDVFSNLTRGLESTSNADHNAGAFVGQEVTARSHSVHTEVIRNIEQKIGIGADTPTIGDLLRGTGSGTSTWGPLTSQEIRDAMGFDPVNKAGDVMTGDLELDNLHVRIDAHIDRDTIVGRNLHVTGDVQVDDDLTANGDVALPGAATIGSLLLNGFLTTKGIRLPVTSVSSDYTIQSNDVCVFGSPTANDVNLQFPPASDRGRLLITKIPALNTPHKLFLVGYASELIDGQHIRAYIIAHAGHIWVADGTNWILVSVV